MAVELAIKKDASCVSGYVKVGGSACRVFQIYHTRKGMPDVEFAMAYAEKLKQLMLEVPWK